MLSRAIVARAVSRQEYTMLPPFPWIDVVIILAR